MSVRRARTNDQGSGGPARVGRSHREAPYERSPSETDRGDVARRVVSGWSSPHSVSEDSRPSLVHDPVGAPGPRGIPGFPLSVYNRGIDPSGDRFFEFDSDGFVSIDWDSP